MSRGCVVGEERGGRRPTKVSDQDALMSLTKLGNADQDV